MTDLPAGSRQPSWRGLPPEAELLLLASSGEPGSERFRQLAESPLDWEQLTMMALRSHATSALWRRLQQTPGLDLNRQAAQLQTLAVLNEFKLHHIRKLLEQVIALLAEQGIEIMLLKGAALLAGGTRRPPERSMSDLDLLVVKGSAPDAWRVCRSAGWEARYQNADDQYEEHHHLPPLIDPAGVGIGLELHRSLLPGSAAGLGVDETALVARARVMRVGRTDVRVPTLEDLLLHACLHFGWGHQFSRHSWCTFADLHTIVADPDFHWSRFLDVVRRSQGGRCCYWTLRLARTGTGLPVPEHVLDALPHPALPRLGSALERHFLAQLYDPEGRFIPERLRQALFRLAVRTRNGEGRPQQEPKPTRREDDKVLPEPPAPDPEWPRSILTLRYLWQLVFPASRQPGPDR